MGTNQKKKEFMGTTYDEFDICTGLVAIRNTDSRRYQTGYAVGELNRKLEDAEKKVDQLQDSVQRFVIILEVISTPIC